MKKKKKKKKKKVTKKTSQGVFDNITANAIDYLKNSIDEFETKPKYSLIHFITALELFIKARLLKEHWTLLLENIDRGTFDNFMQGESNTIDFKTANNRLTNILKQPLNKKEFDCFEKLRKHRNKLIHFFNKDYSGKSQKVKAQVLYELSEGWFYLYRLLTDKWKPEFKDYLKQIRIINRKIARNKKFWQGKFNALKDDITLQRERGVVYEYCYICGFDATRLAGTQEYLYDGKCLICNALTHWLEVECPDEGCGETTYISDAESHCDYCDEAITFGYLEETYGLYNSSSDGTHGREETYCSECCDVDATIAQFGDDFLCLSCFTLFDELSHCDWCHTRYAGDIGEDTNIVGCERCDGCTG